jgi:hypothetical protein
MAKLIKVDGSETIVHPKDSHFTLEELQAFVGGYVQMIQLPNGEEMYLNEEGKLENLPINRRATTLGKVCGIATDDCIVGDVIILNSQEIQACKEAD